MFSPQFLRLKGTFRRGILERVHSGKKVSVRFALYEVKWVVFNLAWWILFMLPHSCWSDKFETLTRPFKWGTAWSVTYFMNDPKDIRNTSSQIFGYSSLLNNVSHFWYFWIWLVVILMPLEEELYAVPHLKGLINVKNISGRQEHVGISMK